MRFNITLVDPPGQRCAHFLFDLMRYLAHSIESLGHDCTIERNRCVADRTNILVGIHHLRSRGEAKELLGPSRDYIVYQTEILRNERVNDHDDGRYKDIVLPLLKGAKAVWESLHSNAEEFKARGIDFDFLRFGYHPAMKDIVFKKTRDIDFLFYGSITPHRKAVTEKLSQLGYRVRVDFDSAAFYRNDLIARSEIVLTLRQSETMNHMPYSRVVYLVNNGVLVVGDGGLEQEALEDVFVWTKSDDVIELCRETLARTDRRQLAEQFHEAFRSRPMTSFLAPLLEKLER
jgi:hypothetical protein